MKHDRTPTPSPPPETIDKGCRRAFRSTSMVRPICNYSCALSVTPPPKLGRNLRSLGIFQLENGCRTNC